MRVETIGTGHEFTELVPTELKQFETPTNFADLSSVKRAKFTIDCFNNSRREHEHPRRLLSVQKIITIKIYDAKASEAKII